MYLHLLLAGRCLRSRRTEEGIMEGSSCLFFWCGLVVLSASMCLIWFPLNVLVEVFALPASLPQCPF